MRAESRRTGWLTAVLLLLLTAVFLRDVLWPAQGWALAGHDVQAQFYPWLSDARAAVWQGRLPLWDANQFGGYPFLANPQVALFYPPTWLALLLPVNVGLSWFVWLHLWLAGVGMAGFVRLRNGRGNGRGHGALLAAIAFTFSGVMAARIWAGHVGIVASFAWTPWLLWATAWAAAHPSRWAGVVAGAPLGLLLLAGNPPAWLVVGSIWLLFGLFLAWQQKIWGRVAGLYGVAGLTGLALSAVQLWPLLQFTRFSSRAAAATFESATAFSLPPAHLITLLLPEFFGEPTRAGYWSVPTYEELVYYAGVLPLLAVLLALGRGGKRRWFWLGLAVLGILLALGSYGFLYGIVFDWLPPFRLARAPARFAFFFTLAAAVLLGGVFSRCDDGGQAKWLRTLLWAGLIGGAAGLAATGALFAVQHPSETSGSLWHQLGGWAWALALFLAAGGLLWRRQGAGRTAVSPRLQNGIVAALALLLLVDLWTFGDKLIYLEPVDAFPLWQDARALIDDEAARVLPWGVPLFDQNGAGAAGLHSLFGYSPLEIGVNNRFIASVPDPRATTYDILGAAYVVSNQPQQRFAEGEGALALLGSTERAWVYRRARPLPVARLVGGVEIIPDEAAAIARVHQPGFDPATTVILAQPPDCELDGGQRGGTAVVTAQSDGYWRIETGSDAAALLVLAETAYPGWRVWIDGQEAAWQTAYTAVRAVCLPPGTHVVEWRFRPLIFWQGGIVSLLALLLLGTAVWRITRYR